MNVSSMDLSRRQAIKSVALSAGALSLAGCERLVSRLSGELGQAVPEALSIPNGKTIDPAFHLLSRAAYGPWPGDIDRVRSIGAEAWIDEQLHPDQIDDKLCDLRARRFETLHHEPGTCYEYKKPVLREEITRHTLLRAVYSKRQLFEVMVSFWTDHLNINIEKGDCIYLKPSDDRLVVRAHALGRFRDLIRASATSPAMLVYLDGNQNKAGPEGVPNENYARELLELHTLGVGGGYNQNDVYEVARCLTGWRLRTGWRRGTVYFDPTLHDDGEKQVLGQVIRAGGGEADLDRVVDIVCNHLSTARHIASKLVARFVSDEPPTTLVDHAARVFTETVGDIRSVVRIILTSEEFRSARGSKLKRPFHYIVSCLRALGADTHAHAPLIEYLTRMGQAPFQYPTPDGYPDKATSWVGTLLWRWNFALALASNDVPSVKVDLDRLAQALGGLTPDRALPHIVGRVGTTEENSALEAFLNGGPEELSRRAELIGLILASPANQRC